MSLHCIPFVVYFEYGQHQWQALHELRAKLKHDYALLIRRMPIINSRTNCPLSALRSDFRILWTNWTFCGFGKDRAARKGLVDPERLSGPLDPA